MNLLKLKRKIFYFLFKTKSPKLSLPPLHQQNLANISGISLIVPWDGLRTIRRSKHGVGISLPPPPTHTMRMSISPLPQYSLGNGGRGGGEDAILLEI
jgi:hypothetical protein